MTYPERQPTLLGIDLGTSSVKILITDARGTPISQAEATYPVLYPDPVQAESRPGDWWLAITTAVGDALRNAPDTVVAGIGLSGQMHGVVLVDDGFVPVSNAILWADARAVDQLTTYRTLPAPVRQRLANPLGPGMAGPILGWMVQHQPRTIDQTRWALQPKDWVRAQLTDTVATEPSDASATLLYDLHQDCWDLDVAAALGLDPTVLAPILPAAGSLAGHLTDSAARQLGLVPGIPVAAGGRDTAVAALGSGLFTPGSVQLTIGTGAQLVTPVDKPPEGRRDAGANGWTEPITHLYRAATTAGWYRMAAVLNGGLALNWARQILGVSWAELYAAAAQPGRADDPLFLPHLNGERTPYLDATLRGAWVGLGPRHTRADLLRAALEGVAFAIKDAYLALFPDSGHHDSQLRLAGGGTTATAWRQLLADVLDVTLQAVDIPAASGRGAAMLGGLGAGQLSEPQLLAELAPTLAHAAIPDPGRATYYDDRHAQFLTTVTQLRAVGSGDP